MLKKKYFFVFLMVLISVVAESCGRKYPPIYAMWYNYKTGAELKIDCTNRVTLPSYLSDSLNLDGDNILHTVETSDIRIEQLFFINHADTFYLGTWNKFDAAITIGDVMYTRRIVYVCRYPDA